VIERVFKIALLMVVGYCCVIVVACGRSGSNLLTTFGSDEPMAGGMAIPVSDEFGPEQAQKLYERVSAEAFLAALAKYNCGDPVSKMVFKVQLFQRSAYASRRVEVGYSVRLDPAGRQRGMVFGIQYLAMKAAGEIDPKKSWSSTYQKPDGETFEVSGGYSENEEPICDCSKRGSGGEWVTFASEKDSGSATRDAEQGN